MGDPEQTQLEFNMQPDNDLFVSHVQTAMAPNEGLIPPPVYETPKICVKSTYDYSFQDQSSLSDQDMSRHLNTNLFPVSQNHLV